MTTVTNKDGIEFDIDAIVTDLNGKADKDLINVSSNVSVCIESWHDENGNWYRVYSDGWCEQGGEYTTAIATNGNVQITLLKPFKDTNYNVQVTARFESRTDGSSSIAMGAYAEETTLFSIVNDGSVSNNKGAFWRACGYIR